MDFFFRGDPAGVAHTPSVISPVPPSTAEGTPRSSQAAPPRHGSTSNRTHSRSTTPRRVSHVAAQAAHDGQALIWLKSPGGNGRGRGWMLYLILSAVVFNSIGGLATTSPSVQNYRIGEADKPGPRNGQGNDTTWLDDPDGPDFSEPSPDYEDAAFVEPPSEADVVAAIPHAVPPANVASSTTAGRDTYTGGPTQEQCGTAAAFLGTSSAPVPGRRATTRTASNV